MASSVVDLIIAKTCNLPGSSLHSLQRAISHILVYDIFYLVVGHVQRRCSAQVRARWAYRRNPVEIFGRSRSKASPTAALYCQEPAYAQPLPWQHCKTKRPCALCGGGGDTPNTRQEAYIPGRRGGVNYSRQFILIIFATKRPDPPPPGRRSRAIHLLSLL